MKILFFADVHGDKEMLKLLKEKSQRADIVVNAGDFTRMEDDIEDIMKQLNDFNKPQLIIHGNHEDEHRVKDLCNKHPNLIFLHKAYHLQGNHLFLGYGGDGFSTNDPDFERVANNFFKPESEGKHRIILVTHGPPYDSKIDVINDDPRGNKSYKKFIEDVKPHMVVAGHLHETAHVHHQEGRTMFINPGKDGVIVNI